MEFGNGNVFRDLGSLYGGDDYANVIREYIGTADVVIASIGPTWVARLKQPGDFVFKELFEALKADRRVIPILIGDTKLPAYRDLPKELRRILAGPHRSSTS